MRNDKWRVREICCSRELGPSMRSGRVFDTWEEADKWRQQWVESEDLSGHERRGIVEGLSLEGEKP